ncbi:MAG: galactokinase family protein, partial [Gammaproteobacteria bacterium]
MPSKLSSDQKEYKASAPGSLMLIGEHVVLYGGVALVCAVDQRVSATLRPRQDKIIKLSSDMAGEIILDVTKLRLTLVKKLPEWRFVLAAIVNERNNIKKGFELEIKSQQKDPIG